MTDPSDQARGWLSALVTCGSVDLRISPDKWIGQKWLTNGYLKREQQQFDCGKIKVLDMNIQNILTKSINAPSNQRVVQEEDTSTSTSPWAGVSHVNSDGSTTTTLLNDADFIQAWQASSIVHQSQAYQKAGDAIDKINSQLDVIEKSISALRPNIKSTDWDFSLKDGNLVVSSSKLSDVDVKMIEGKLNHSKVLIDAVNSFMSAAVTNLQTASDNPVGTTQNIYTGARQNLTFDKVAEQLNGTLDFKHFLAENKDLATVHGALKLEAVNFGYSALNLLGSRLKSDESLVGYAIFPTAGTV